MISFISRPETFSYKGMLGLLAATLLVMGCGGNQKADTIVSLEPGSRIDLRPPAYPLVMVDPYFSIWSFTDELYTDQTRHWTGAEHNLNGYLKVDDQVYSFLGKPAAQYEAILPLGERSGTWQVTEKKPAEGWMKVDYDATSWKTKTGAFSNGNDKKATNVWKTDDIWVRREFEIKEQATDLLLQLHHDDAVEVYINGILAFQNEHWNSKAEYKTIAPEALAAIRPGNNVLAIHCHNTTGGAYLDAGIARPVSNKIETLPARQIDVNVTATQTYYTFEAGGVELRVAFTSPMYPDEVAQMTRPLNFFTAQTKSLDGSEHEVSVLFSAGEEITKNQPSQPAKAELVDVNGLNAVRVGTTSQEVLVKKGDDVRIDWGYLYLAAPKGSNHNLQTGSPEQLLDIFVSGDGNPGNAESLGQSIAATMKFGSVGATPAQGHLILAYDDLESIQYFGQDLKAWWHTAYPNFGEMLTATDAEYVSVLEKATAFDKKLHGENQTVAGKSYADLCAIAYRQSLAAHKAVISPDNKLLYFSKENFSNGSIGTVDITYPSAPLFLIYQPEMLKGMLEFIFYYSESGRWKKPFPAHDVGTYPLANGQTYGEDMPVEEAGNMVLLTAALVQAEGNADFAKKHWETLRIWADFLAREGLDPGNQLCTDDFAGHLAHNANLSVKAIVALGAFGQLAEKVGEKETADEFTGMAKDFAGRWMEMSEDGDHYSLTFDKKDTWSQKYNLIWDQVLDMDIFPKSVAETELAFYLGKQNKYGLPLDSRKTYSKSDWIIWTASLSDDRSQTEELIQPVFDFANETPDRIPLSDWYETTDAKSVGFRARSVVGGYFMPLLKAKQTQN